MFKWKPGKLEWLKGKWKLPSMSGAYSADWMGPCIDAQRPKGMAMAMGISAGEPVEEHQDRRRGAASHS